MPASVLEQFDRYRPDTPIAEASACHHLLVEEEADSELPRELGI